MLFAQSIGVRLAPLRRCTALASSHAPDARVTCLCHAANLYLRLQLCSRVPDATLYTRSWRHPSLRQCAFAAGFREPPSAVVAEESTFLDTAMEHPQDGQVRTYARTERRSSKSNLESGDVGCCDEYTRCIGWRSQPCGLCSCCLDLDKVSAQVMVAASATAAGLLTAAQQRHSSPAAGSLWPRASCPLDTSFFEQRTYIACG